MKSIQHLNIGVIKPHFFEYLDEQVELCSVKFLSHLTKQGASLVELDTLMPWEDHEKYLALSNRHFVCIQFEKYLKDTGFTLDDVV